uniref:Uncharacterized protein n=1 Tax=Phytophthora ramorum TaxID=164328 RepID=H3HBU8_PHYRM
MGVAFRAIDFARGVYPCASFNRRERLQFNLGGTPFKYPPPPGFQPILNVLSETYFARDMHPSMLRSSGHGRSSGFASGSGVTKADALAEIKALPDSRVYVELLVVKKASQRQYARIPWNSSEAAITATLLQITAETGQSWSDKEVLSHPNLFLAEWITARSLDVVTEVSKHDILPKECGIADENGIGAVDGQTKMRLEMALGALPLQRLVDLSQERVLLCSKYVQSLVELVSAAGLVMSAVGKSTDELFENSSSQQLQACKRIEVDLEPIDQKEYEEAQQAQQAVEEALKQQKLEAERAAAAEAGEQRDSSSSLGDSNATVSNGDAAAQTLEEDLSAARGSGVTNMEVDNSDSEEAPDITLSAIANMVTEDSDVLAATAAIAAGVGRRTKLPMPELLQEKANPIFEFRLPEKDHVFDTSMLNTQEIDVLEAAKRGIMGEEPRGWKHGNDVGVLADSHTQVWSGTLTQFRLRQKQEESNQPELKVGCKVIRGPNWKWRDQDGGEGSVGVVEGVSPWSGVDGEGMSVRWPNDSLYTYRWGADGNFDLIHVEVDEDGNITHQHATPKVKQEDEGSFGSEIHFATPPAGAVKVAGLMEWPDYGAAVRVVGLRYADESLCIQELQLTRGNPDMGWMLRFGSEKWQPVTCHSGESRNLALGTVGFTTGVHYWEVHVEQAEFGSVFIGVCEKAGPPGSQAALSSRLNRWHGWGFVNFRATYHNSTERIYGDHFNASDTIGVRLDMEQGKLSFFMDGIKFGEHIVSDLGVAFENMKGERNSRTLYPCIGMRKGGDRVTLNQKWISMPGVSPRQILSDAVDASKALHSCVKLPGTLLRESWSEWKRWSDNHWQRCHVRPRGISVDFDTSPAACVRVSNAAGLGAPLLAGDRVRVYRGFLWYRTETQGNEGADEGRAWACAMDMSDYESAPERGPFKPRSALEERARTDFNAFVELATQMEEDARSTDATSGRARTRSLVVEDYFTSPALKNISGPELRARTAVLRVLNSKILRVLPIIAIQPDDGSSTQPIEVAGDKGSISAPTRRSIDFLSMSLKLRSLRRLVFTSTKRAFWDDVLRATTTSTPLPSDEYEDPREIRVIRINRIQAQASKLSLLSQPGDRLRRSVFGQLYREMRAWSDSFFRRAYCGKGHGGQRRAFKVKFLGEGVNDYGGPYRAVFEQIVDELQMDNVELAKGEQGLLPLLIPCPNRRSGTGSNQDKFLLNPSCGTALLANGPMALDLHRFLGKLIGTAVRHGLQMGLDLPALVWRPLAGLEELSTETEEAEEVLGYLTLSTTLSDGAEVLLVPQGEKMPVTLANRELYVQLVEKTRLTESSQQLAALKDGLASVLPMELAPLFTPRELEVLICGRREVDVDLLRQCTEYSEGADEAMPHVQHLWEVLREMTSEERTSFLRFVWARSRMPNSAKDFPMNFKVQAAHDPGAVGQPDLYLPHAQTCFFALRLPAYTSKETLRTKLLYAIQNSPNMDADVRLHNAEGHRYRPQLRILHVMGHRALAALLALHAAALYLFTTGFFLTRFEVSDLSSCQASPSDVNAVPAHLRGGQEDLARPDDEASQGCWMPRRFRRVVFVVIDALRFDFAASGPRTERSTFYSDRLPILNDTLVSEPEHALLLKFVADPPTMTMQRLKGLTTGSLPTFLDIKDNMAASSQIVEDNLLRQLRAQQRGVVFMGDDTWDALYAREFTRKFAFDSFNVKDLHSVDRGVTAHLFPELRKPDWDLLIAHFLGVDHVGHTHGPSSVFMAEKLDEMNGMLKRLLQELKGMPDGDDVLLAVLGDHGMSADGNHGGASDEETGAALFLYSKASLVAGGVGEDEDAKELQKYSSASQLPERAYDQLEKLFTGIKRVEDQLQQVQGNQTDPAHSKADIPLLLRLHEDLSTQQQHYLREALALGRSIWTQFDLCSMGWGMLLLGYIVAEGNVMQFLSATTGFLLIACAQRSDTSRSAATVAALAFIFATRVSSALEPPNIIKASATLWRTFIPLGATAALAVGFFTKVTQYTGQRVSLTGRFLLALSVLSYGVFPN